MKEFTYFIKDEIGLHARPAGMLAKKAAGFKSNITISSGNKKADAKGMLGIMMLAVKNNQRVDIMIEGEDEDAALLEIEKFMKENV